MIWIILLILMLAVLCCGLAIGAMVALDLIGDLKHRRHK